jgi:hypothetical protein
VYRAAPAASQSGKSAASTTGPIGFMREKQPLARHTGVPIADRPGDLR